MDNKSLSWGLCVSTLNRIDILESCVSFAISQSRPPSEVVIVDASDNWELHRDRIFVLTEKKSVPLKYLPAIKKSLATQRNQGIKESSADILFLIDDDSLLYPDAASEILKLYESESGTLLSAIGLSSRSKAPSELQKNNNEKEYSASGKKILNLRKYSLVKWAYREVFLLTLDRLFLKYCPHPKKFIWENYPNDAYPDAWYTDFIGGYALTVRRDHAVSEPFNKYLLGYCPMEDLDAVYRWKKLGFTIYSKNAGVYHAEVSQSRINRKKVIQLQLSNLAFFVRLNSDNLKYDYVRVFIRITRRIISEFIKDAGTFRFSFPQLRGALAAVPVIFRILTISERNLPEWYESYQSQLLWGKPHS